ncbi:MAG: ATP-binding protein [Gallionella sp.]|nr:ATP-binding protein [Gallionella sp.]
MEFFFLRNHFSELDRSLLERGKLITSQFGSSSEYGVISNNQPFMQKIAGIVLQQPDVRGLMILNAASQNLIESGEFSGAAKNALADIKLATSNYPSQAGLTHANQGNQTQALHIRELDNSPATIQNNGESLLIYQHIVPEKVLLDEALMGEYETILPGGQVGTVIIEMSLARTKQLKSKMLWSTITATAIFLALILYAVHLTTHHITYPVSLLSNAVQKIGQGNLETRVAESSRVAELDILAHGINKMAAKLQQESANLQHLIEERTIQVMQAKQLAEAAQHEAERANKAKSKFLAAASHDLRQPIHAQGLFLGVLSRTELTADQHELLSCARAASEASGEMLNTLLDFSRIEAGVVKPQVQSFLLQPLFNKIENEFAPQADAKGLVYRSRETPLAAQSDPMLVELILRNLVSNAIRYTEHGGVLVACRQRGNQAVLEVWDTGIGIEPAHQQEVFHEFHQLGNPERDTRKGLGLGLAISDGLARTLDHGLSLASTPLCGSVFRLALPIATAALPIKGPVAARGNTGALNARILVIDDDEAVRAAMLHLLRNWGCECEAAESIEDALAMARTHAPDVIVSDYRLREQRTGAEAIAALRALLGSSLPALLITGDTAPERLREAQASGIPLLHKPVSPSELYSGLMEVLEGTA